jgi:hypothetical protein
MKKILRMIVFSMIAVFLTSLWDKGFIVKFDWFTYIKASLLIALIFYLVFPITKLVLLPLNILSLGFVSTIAYCFIFYFLSKYFSLIDIKPWVFSGGSFLGIVFSQIKINQITNVFVSAISVSTIINFLEKII